MTSILREASSTQMGELFSLSLLDTVQGHPVQTWKLDGQEVVRIGRLEENDVVLADPIVSRLHATIKQANGEWELLSLGKHGIFVNDRRIESLILNHETVFRLGPNGPTLQFLHPHRVAPKESQINRTTLEFDPDMLSLLDVDEEQAAEEVREITENEDFQRLLERARELREKRS